MTNKPISFKEAYMTTIKKSGSAHKLTAQQPTGLASTATTILTRRKMFVISLMAFFVGLITMLLGLVALDVFTTSVGFLAFAGGCLWP